ncbi:TetR/AcrR family transcriptional regulator [Desulfovermiculus halophilus]|jgi:TetR/AcrR family fatty acid metabolism transcriptional regulator|uniref:TetR/AcrR family transcriptional regulator n=1 Tax=Desulfovermiculus halophilus TaxID=339722 RepID=UPI00048901D3|nr:TetR/AcrR family transcriptional regulator [Desulfovermiculus halophilus]
MSTSNSNSKKSNKYQTILEAAIRVFARSGYHNSTVSQIAKEAGVADGTIYLYFKNKDDILENFFSYKTALVFDRFKEEVGLADNALEKLEKLIHRHLYEFEQNREMAVVYQTETKVRRKVSDAKVKEMSDMYFGLVSEIISQGQQEGVIRKNLSVPLVKQLIIGAIDEVITSWLYSSRTYSLTSTAGSLVELFVQGIGETEDR